jgi:hypothetical protein
MSVEPKPKPTSPSKPALKWVFILVLGFIPVSFTACIPACATPAAYLLCRDGGSHRVVFDRHTTANNHQVTNWRIQCEGGPNAFQPSSLLTGFVQFLTYLPFSFGAVFFWLWFERWLGIDTEQKSSQD